MLSLSYASSLSPRLERDLATLFTPSPSRVGHPGDPYSGVGTFAKEKVLELMLINLRKKERCFGVLRRLGWLLEWNTTLIHCVLDQVFSLVV